MGLSLPSNLPVLSSSDESVSHSQLRTLNPTSEQRTEDRDDEKSNDAWNLRLLNHREDLNINLGLPKNALEHQIRISQFIVIIYSLYI